MIMKLNVDRKSKREKPVTHNLSNQKDHDTEFSLDTDITTRNNRCYYVLSNTDDAVSAQNDIN